MDKNYFFDPETGEFLYAAEQELSSLDPVEPLGYEDAISIAPPEEKPEHNAVVLADKSGWECVEDHRGKNAWSTDDGTKIEISDLGPLPDNITTLAPPSVFHKWKDGDWSLDKNAVIDAKKREILAERDRQIEEGGFKVDKDWFYSDAKSRELISELFAAVQMCDNDQDMINGVLSNAQPWKTMAGEEVEVGGLYLTMIRISCIKFTELRYSAARKHGSALRYSNSPDEYDYMTDLWPEQYQKEVE